MRELHRRRVSFTRCTVRRTDAPLSKDSHLHRRMSGGKASVERDEFCVSRLGEGHQVVVGPEQVTPVVTWAVSPAPPAERSPPRSRRRDVSLRKCTFDVDVGEPDRRAGRITEQRQLDFRL